jgi:hypothetical protein
MSRSDLNKPVSAAAVVPVVAIARDRRLVRRARAIRTGGGVRSSGRRCGRGDVDGRIARHERLRTDRRA